MEICNESIQNNPYLIVKDGLIVETNQYFSNLTGYTKDEILQEEANKIFNKYLHISCDIANLPEEKECFLFTKALQPYKVLILSKKVTNRNHITYIFYVKANLRLDSKLLIAYKFLTDNEIGVGIYSCPGLILLDANQKYLNLLNEPYNKAETSFGSKICDFVHRWNDSKLEKIWLNTIASGNTFYGKEIKGFTGIWKDHYYNNTIIPISEGNEVKYAINFVEDITKRILVEQKKQEQIKVIKHQLKQLQTITENMSEALLFVDTLGNFTFINKSAKKISLINDTINALNKFEKTRYSDLDGNILPLKDTPAYRALRGEIIKNERLILNHHNNHPTIIEVSSSPIYDDGKIVSAVVSFHDITDMIKNEQLIEAQKEQLLINEKEKNIALEKSLQMKDEFLSLISHEFKTPLTVINAAIQAIEFICKKDLSEKTMFFINKIKQNSFRQLKLINNLLDITRSNSNNIKIHKESVDIALLTRLIIESVSLYAQQKGVKLTYSSTFKQKIIEIDIEKYDRILLNLISNAIKFTPKDKEISIKLYSINNAIYVKIKDHGIGIPQDKIGLIFERFGQVDSTLSRQAEGTGLGLALVKKLVESLEGNISVQSKLGKGSTFTVVLPISNKINSENFNHENIKKESYNQPLSEAISIEFSDIYTS